MNKKRKKVLFLFSLSLDKRDEELFWNISKFYRNVEKYGRDISFNL